MPTLAQRIVTKKKWAETELILYLQLSPGQKSKYNYNQLMCQWRVDSLFHLPQSGQIEDLIF